MRVLVIVLALALTSISPAKAGLHVRVDVGAAKAEPYARTDIGPREGGSPLRFALAQAAAPATPSGDAKRGKTLFDETYRCYACHGYAGETGSPRLVPMSRTEEAFVTFVRNPSRPAMPAFSDVAAKDLADVYAYLRSLQPNPRPVQDIPLLRDILEQIGGARP